jgi:hypothetical protein
MVPVDTDSFLSRPAKISPLISCGLGLVLIPIGYALRGAIGGALEGGGIALVLMGVWDFTRLRYVAWRQSRVPDTSNRNDKGGA